mmetsp:Transcript_16373/g.35400  ORF Transcript_16373/g.35400 Transcript_16373/m.35400 type:complete len:277 (-) Transcript_16373:759-1589(-)
MCPYAISSWCREPREEASSFMAPMSCPVAAPRPLPAPAAPAAPPPAPCLGAAAAAVPLLVLFVLCVLLGACAWAVLLPSMPSTPWCPRKSWFRWTRVPRPRVPAAAAVSTPAAWSCCRACWQDCSTTLKGVPEMRCCTRMPSVESSLMGCGITMRGSGAAAEVPVLEPEVLLAAAGWSLQQRPASCRRPLMVAMSRASRSKSNSLGMTVCISKTTSTREKGSRCCRKRATRDMLRRSAPISACTSWCCTLITTSGPCAQDAPSRFIKAGDITAPCT